MCVNDVIGIRTKFKNVSPRLIYEGGKNVNLVKIYWKKSWQNYNLAPTHNSFPYANFCALNYATWRIEKHAKGNFLEFCSFTKIDMSKLSAQVEGTKRLKYSLHIKTQNYFANINSP